MNFLKSGGGETNGPKDKKLPWYSCYWNCCRERIRNTQLCALVRSTNGNLKLLNQRGRESGCHARHCPVLLQRRHTRRSGTARYSKRQHEQSKRRHSLCKIQGC